MAVCKSLIEIEESFSRIRSNSDLAVQFFGTGIDFLHMTPIRNNNVALP